MTRLTSTGGIRYRHVKSGGVYEIVAHARMQTEHWMTIEPNPAAIGVDMAEVIVYRLVEGGPTWVRPRYEFEDGRFEAI